MKYIVIIAVCVIALLLFVSCGSKDSNNGGIEPVTQKTDKIAGSKVSAADVMDFYYTYEWIGYNAEYQRYRFYVEDGKRMFFHESRKVEEDYGPATEKNTTAIGTIELDQEEWDKFLDLIKGGKLHKPEESTSTGDSGPWMYLYHIKGKDINRMAYEFGSYGEKLEFEEFCQSLASKG